MQTPSVGRIVIVVVDPATNNGSDEAPAVISRVWGPECVNVRVLLDGHDTPWMTSVALHAERPENPQHAAWWPPRV